MWLGGLRQQRNNLPLAPNTLKGYLDGMLWPPDDHQLLRLFPAVAVRLLDVDAAASAWHPAVL